MNKKLINLLIGTCLLWACTNESVTENGLDPDSISMNLSVNSMAVNDPAAINQDQTFSSLAIYLYSNDAASTLEESALLPSFSSVSTKDIRIQTHAGTKLIYIIANYTGKTFKQANGTPLILSNTTTKQELENIITESSGGFTPNSLLMVGKQTITVTSADNGKLVDLILRRLQARIDVHIFKGPSLQSDIVTLQSVTLYNQALNSEVKFEYDRNTAQMVTPPLFNNQTITSNATLLSFVNGTQLQPADAKASFYSYQNLATSAAESSAPYLEIKLQVAGSVGTRTYKGYLTDNNQTVNKYSLLQNNVYQVKATLDVDSRIVLNLNILPWNQKDVEYERPITGNDFSFGAWGNSWGGTNGKTMHTNVDGLEDAVFQFELKAPQGAAWTATITNGLDFGFTQSTAGTTTTTVSSGFTNNGSPALIAVRALKKWTGEGRDTEFYITVEGNEIPINPLVGSQRLYEGTETRIKIRQVASYN